jgi:tRNA dimethylallyltransferase
MSSTAALDGDSIRVICGPTAAGKSAIATRLAIEYGATIISADSRQIYRGFDIGTAKPSSSELRVVPHRGIDVVDPTERYSASRWASDAMQWIQEALRNNRIPLIVGGTGFYIRALFEPLFDAPPLDPTRRSELERWMSTRSVVELREMCKILDPEKSHLGRTQLSRAIEIALLSGHRLSILQRQAGSAQREEGSGPRAAGRFLVVDPQSNLAAHIEHRVDAMISAGWAQEVQALIGNVPADAPAWKASGYRAMRAHVEGDVDLSDTRARIIIETRQYAKRQRTWFRHQLDAFDVTRINPDDPGADAAVERWWKGAATT